MQLWINGQARQFPSLAAGSCLTELVGVLELKGDRVAIERNGEIVPRKQWPETALDEGDRLEMVHFVGGGSWQPRPIGAFVLLLVCIARAPAQRGRGGPQAPHAVPEVPEVSDAPTFTVRDLRPGQDLRLIVYGDMRFTAPSNTTDTWPGVRKYLAQKVGEERPDALLVTGDVPLHGSDPADWKVFADETESWRSNGLRVFPTIGNHEVIPDLGSGYANYAAAFPQVRGYHAYSVLMGNVYIVSLNTTEPLWPKSAQAEWMKTQLDHIPPQVDFIFLMMHVPLIADAQSEFLANIPSPDLLGLREYLEARAATMRQKMVVVCGHIHNYERFEKKGIAHIISGGGGAKPYPVYLRGPEDLYLDTAYPNFNYVVITIHGGHADAAMYSVVDPTAKRMSVAVKDRFSLDAGASRRPVR